MFAQVLAVQLQRNAPSSVNVIQDSLASVRDVASIRLNRALGRYRSTVLPQLLERELRADLAGTAQAADAPELRL